MKPWSPTSQQLLCRDLQHSWDPSSAWREDRGYVRLLRCWRCKSWKRQTLDRDGYIVETKMLYPEGYLRPEGRMTRADRAELRVGNTDA